MSYLPDPAPDAFALADYLNSLPVATVRALAAGPGMRYRHESTKSEIIDFLIRYSPESVRADRAERRTGSA